MDHSSPVSPAAERAEGAGLRRVLDALPAGVVVIDGAGRVEDCNAAARALLGEPLHGARWRDVVDRILSAGPGAPGVDGLTLPGGRQVTVATAPLGDGPGQIVLINDVTETRVMQALMERRQRLSSIGETVASLSHQIRTPLASSLLYVSQLERANLAGEARRRCVGKLRACLDHANKLVRDMLTYAGGGALNAEEFAVSDLLADFRGLSAALLDGARCRLAIIDHSDGARIHGNRDALTTVLQNILENAVHACAAHRPEGGHVRLLIRRTGGGAGEAVEITLSDDGAGIPAALRQRVLEPFFTTKSQGTGLGLPVARAVAQAHRGVLWIESEEGAGTTIGLRLPVSAHAAGIPAARARELQRSVG